MSGTLYALTGALADLHRMGDEADDESVLEAVRDTLEGLTGDLNDKIDAVAKARTNILSAAEIEHAKAEPFRAEAERYSARGKALDRRAAELDGYVLRCLQQAKLPKIETESHTASIRKGRPSVVITDEKAIPTQLVTVKTTKQPDKRAIGDQLKAGETVPGAKLESGPDKVVIR